MEETLCNLLKSTRKNLSENISEEHCRNIKTEEIRRKINIFKKQEVEPIINEIEQVEKIVQSPYHVGFLGRYSHGKTALVNSLFNLDDETRLPEGDGIVTSKVTYASFERNRITASAYEVPHGENGEQNPVPVTLEELRGLVGKSDVDTSAINYFKLYLPAEGSNKSFSGLFADKNINLVDMPGLGGTYYKDAAETRRYLKEMDIIVVVIRMDEIEQSGLVLNSMIGEYSNLITALTFSDSISESKVFSDCDGDPDKAICKARELIHKHIPNLHLTDLITVSSKPGYEPNNIDALRTLILSRIASSDIAIHKAHKDIAPVYKRRLAEFQTAYSGLKSNLERLGKEIEKILKSVVPENSRRDIDILSDIQKNTRLIRAGRELDKEINRGVNECYSHYRELVESLRGCGENDYEARIEKVCKTSNGSMIKNLEERISSSYHSFCDTLYSELNRTISGLTLDMQTRSGLIDDIRECCELSSIDFKDVQIINDKTILTKRLAAYTKQLGIKFFEGLIHDPTSLIMVALGIVLCNVTFFGWKPGVFVTIGGISIACGVVSVLIKQPEQRKKAFREAMEQIINDLDNLFDSNDWKERIQRMKNDSVCDLNEEIKNVLKKDVQDYNRDIKFLSDAKNDIDKSVYNLSAKLEEEMCNNSIR